MPAVKYEKKMTYYCTSYVVTYMFGGNRDTRYEICHIMIMVPI